MYPSYEVSLHIYHCTSCLPLKNLIFLVFVLAFHQRISLAPNCAYTNYICGIFNAIKWASQISWELHGTTPSNSLFTYSRKARLTWSHQNIYKMRLILIFKAQSECPTDTLLRTHCLNPFCYKLHCVSESKFEQWFYRALIPTMLCIRDELQASLLYALIPIVTDVFSHNDTCHLSMEIEY